MNPPWHDEFVALCALYPSGELTEEEWALLQVHLAYCDSCRQLFDEYREIVRDVIPAMAAADVATDRTPFLAFDEEKLKDRLGEELPSESRKRIHWLIPALAIAAGVATVGWLGLRGGRQQPTPTAVTTSPVQGPEVARTTIAAPTSPSSEVSLADREAWKKQLRAAEERDTQTVAKLASVEQLLQTEQSDRAKLIEEKDQLNQQLAAARQEVQSLHDRIDAGDANTAQQASRLVALEIKLREATAGIEEKNRLLALDRELLEHDRDIRDLIGARDLYIADIYDVAQNGKTSKPFGRLFYTKDRSLIFYGYDLDKQPGLKQSVAYQVWGTDGAQKNVSLGLFYQDDKNKRWVLRSNDTKTLAHLSKVFVTAEPQGGSSQPTGKPLLSAYLQMQPNHP